MIEQLPVSREQLGSLNLLLLRRIPASNPWESTAVVERDYSVRQEFGSSPPGAPRIIHFKSAPMGLREGDRALVFLSWNEKLRGGLGLYEEAERGHLRVEKINDADHVIYPAPRLWLSKEVPPRLREHFRKATGRPSASTILLAILDSYLREELAAIVWSGSYDKVQQAARALMRQLDFEAALELLTSEVQRLQDPPVGQDALRKFLDPPVGQDALRKVQLLGLVATCHFQSGHPEKALPLLEQTFAFYRELGDNRSSAAALKNLIEVHRYLGQEAKAIDAARKFASDAVYKAVLRGEPLNRVVVDFMGAPRELDALPDLVGVSLRFSCRLNRTQLARCTDRVQRGRELAREGRFEEALALFTEAAHFDARAPEPRYEGAEALLHLHRASEAVAGYDEVEALAPGWYACRARRWLAAAIADGRIPHAAFLLLRELERPDLSAEAKEALARRALREAPGVPELRWHLGRQLVALGREAEAMEVFDEGLSQAEEPDIRSRLRVELAALLPASAERDARLREAMASGGNLIAVAMAGVMLRTGPSQRPDPRRADSTVVVHKRHLTREELEFLVKASLDHQPVPQEHSHLGRHLSLCEDCNQAYRGLIPPQWVR